MVKILLIDDDLSVRDLVKAHFDDGPHKVLLAEDGAHGIGLAVTTKPDVMILDMDMPILDGQSTMRVLQSDPQIAKIPVVVLSADDRQDTRTAMMNAGCAGYLTKPVDLNHLERTILASVDVGAVIMPFPE